MTRRFAPLLCSFCGWIPNPAQSSPTPPPIGHVFVLILENEPFETTFSPRPPAPYLGKSLPQQGALLVNYYAIGHASLGNYIALISGQAPNLDTQTDCAVYTEFRLSQPELDAHGQALGQGCVYPRMVASLPDQLEAANLSWKGYMQDMGNDPTKESGTCGHGVLGRRDVAGLSREPRDQYATRHDPFIYFHRIIDDPARCDAHVVSLTQLPQDLGSLAATPNFVFITPNVCDDGHDQPCIDGRPGGLVTADLFLQHWVPLITGSEAFRKDGLLIISFDEGLDAAACCGEQGLPGAAHPPGLGGPGGGRIGAVLLSPFIKPGTVSDLPYNHYALLRSVEDLFQLSHLGYAAEPDLRPFGTDVFTSSAAAGARNQ